MKKKNKIFFTLSIALLFFLGHFLQSNVIENDLSSILSIEVAGSGDCGFAGECELYCPSGIYACPDDECFTLTNSTPSGTQYTLICWNGGNAGCLC